MRTALAIAAFVIPLGFDTLAVSIALGLQGAQPLRPALLFATFEMAMPLAGIGLGRYVGARVETLAGYVGGLTLIGVGLHMLREMSESEHKLGRLSFGSLREMAAAGLGVSTDEIAIGFPLGALRLPVAVVLAAIGLQAFLVTVLGIIVGRKIGRELGQRTAWVSAALAGTAFVLLGVFLVAERLLGRG
jgi:putative Mn2+ efflux pump MntP